MARHSDQQIGFRSIGKIVDGQSGIDFHCFVGMQVKALGQSINVFGMYLTAGIGIKGENKHKLMQLGALLSSLRTPWLVIGDFNAEQQELHDSGWLELVRGCVGTPTGADYTCVAGKGRLIDYIHT